jgi:hypothetical protein
LVVDLVAVVFAPVATEVVDDVEGDDPDQAGVFAEESAAEDEPVDEEELVEEFAPVVSASAMVGLLAIAAPTPSAIASAPTRPTYFAQLEVVGIVCGARHTITAGRCTKFVAPEADTVRLELRCVA